MKFFSKQETIVVIVLFAILFIVSAINMQTSLRRARDAQRKGDLGAITDALEKFKTHLGFFPPSENGKIKMCKADNFPEVLAKLKLNPQFDTELFLSGLRTCEWGKDGLTDLLDETGTIEPYLKTLPSDPRTELGYSYYYLSSNNRFQIYSFLEGQTEESGYDERIVSRKLNCGIAVCNFGRSYSVPIEREIQEYEAELIKQSGQK